jgi:hypothetical protein
VRGVRGGRGSGGNMAAIPAASLPITSVLDSYSGTNVSVYHLATIPHRNGHPGCQAGDPSGTLRFP